MSSFTNNIEKRMTIKSGTTIYHHVRGAKKKKVISKFEKKIKSALRCEKITLAIAEIYSYSRPLLEKKATFFQLDENEIFGMK